MTMEKKVEFQTQNSAYFSYEVDLDVGHARLEIDNWYFRKEDLTELIDALDNLRDQLAVRDAREGY